VLQPFRCPSTCGSVMHMCRSVSYYYLEGSDNYHSPVAKINYRRRYPSRPATATGQKRIMVSRSLIFVQDIYVIVSGEKGRSLFLPWPANLSRSWDKGGILLICINVYAACSAISKGALAPPRPLIFVKHNSLW
jgi:hypothetical protein